MSTKNPLPFSNQFERGHSFNGAGQGTEGKYYFNDQYVTDFISFGPSILACRKNHLSTSNNKPVIIYGNDGTPSGVQGMLGDFVVSPINGDVFKFVSGTEYQNLTNNNLIKPDVLYFIYDTDE